MKSTVTILFLLLSFLLAGCAGPGATTHNSSGNSSSKVMIDNPNTTLDLYIRQLSGVRVTGSGSSARIIVRGADSSTFESDPRPLFVLDGIRLGRDFSKVYSQVPVHNVTSLELINVSKATLYYGHEGSSGVIEINTREA